MGIKIIVQQDHRDLLEGTVERHFFQERGQVHKIAKCQHAAESRGAEPDHQGVPDKVQRFLHPEQIIQANHHALQPDEVLERQLVV